MKIFLLSPPEKPFSITGSASLEPLARRGNHKGTRM